MHSQLTNLKESEILKTLSKISIGSFNRLFPYRLYDENKKIFINRASLMMIAEIPLLSGANEKLIQELVSLINKNIEDTLFVRIFRITHRNIEKRLSFIENQNSALSGIFESISQKQSDFFRFSAIHGFQNNAGLNTGFLDSRVFIEIAIPCKTSNKDLCEEKMGDLQKVFEKITTELNTANIPLSILDAENFLSILRIFLQFDQDHIAFDYDYDQTRYLNEQLNRLGQRISVQDDAVIFENKDKKYKATTYSASKFPKSFALYNTADFIAHIDKNASITCPHIFSVAFKLIPDEKAKSNARSKYFSLEKQANSVMTRFFPKLKDQFQEWSYVRDQLERDEIKMCEIYISVTLLSDIENHPKYRSQFESTLKSCANSGFEMARLIDIQLPLFLSNFPGLIAENKMWNDLRRAGIIRRQTTWNVVNLLPLLGDWKGSYNGFIAPGMRNQFAAIDIFSDEVPTDNNNVSIAAGSGAGKSVLTQMMIFQVLASGGIVFIIDKGDSYKKLCQLLGGVYIDGKSLKLNPFTYLDRIQDADAIQLYFSMIRDLLATIVSPNGDLDSVSRAYLLESASNAYAKHKEHTNIDSVVEALINIDHKQNESSGTHDRRLQDLITLLKEYTRAGINGQYFNDASTIDPNARLVVLELGSIDANEDLVRSVLFSLINTISQRMYLSDRSQKKMCIIDEAWSLLSSENKLAAKFIEKGFRTSRKHGGSFVTITQGITDYFKDECALACWNNSDIKIILRQNDGALKKFERDHPNIFSQYETYVMSQFKPAKEAGFSSFMLKAGSLTSFHRLFLDPHTRILFSTHPQEFQLVFDLMTHQQMSLWQAIDTAARHFYPNEINNIENYFKRASNAKN